MNKHANHHAEMLEMEEEDFLPMEDCEKHHKYHESLKEIFNKHGMVLNNDFMKDLKEWKSS